MVKVTAGGTVIVIESDPVQPLISTALNVKVVVAVEGMD
jgi:hypothetical protein